MSLGPRQGQSGHPDLSDSYSLGVTSPRVPPRARSRYCGAYAVTRTTQCPVHKFTKLPLMFHCTTSGRFCGIVYFEMVSQWTACGFPDSYWSTPNMFHRLLKHKWPRNPWSGVVKYLVGASKANTFKRLIVLGY